MTAGRRLPITVGIGALVGLAFGCSSAGTGGTALGEAAEFEFDDARIAVTVDAVEPQDISVLDDWDLDDEERAMTPYFVHFDVELLDGDLAVGSNIPFSAYRWSGVDTGGEEAIALQLFALGDVDMPCGGFSAEEAIETLNTAGSVTACHILLAESADGLAEVRLASQEWSTG